MSRAVDLSCEVRAGGGVILGPVELQVEEGEHVLVVGPSGSGKSTLLRAIAGLSRMSGTLSLFGTEATRDARLVVPPEERRIGMLFQGAALWPHMNTERTLRFVLKHRGVPSGEHAARVAKLLEQVELQGYEKRMPGTLSGGEAQRLALARALACEPRLLLLDEPLGPLDAELRGSLLERLGALHTELGLTTLHVTHDPAEAQGIASRVLRIRDGRIESDESLREVPA